MWRERYRVKVHLESTEVEVVKYEHDVLGISKGGFYVNHNWIRVPVNNEGIEGFSKILPKRRRIV
jgi:hypothetical protein